MTKQLPFYFFTLFIAIAISSCDKSDSDDCDPDKVCYTQAPDSLYVKLELAPQNSDLPLEINFYKGDIDDGDKIEYFETSNSEEYYLMPIKEDYSASARYVQGQDTIVVIDGDKLKEDSYTNCDETCYNWDYELVLDLKLEE